MKGGKGKDKRMHKGKQQIKTNPHSNQQKGEIKETGEIHQQRGVSKGATQTRKGNKTPNRKAKKGNIREVKYTP